MSLNLFQKYNPEFLSDIVGQDKTVKELQKRVDNIPHCIYFTGITGVGKTALSRIIAKSILCENKKENLFCNECAICNAINNETHLLNYFEINASNCGIDQMREIEENASRKIGFTNSSFKVFYIDELQEMVSKNKIALKNLLKLLEKPSKYNYFILGSMDDSVIPKAIKNRCVCYHLKEIDDDSMFERLMYISEQEGIKVDDSKIDILNCIIENSDGSMRTAISFLERAIYSDLWNEDDLIKELNIVSESKIENIVNDILNGDIRNLNYSLYNVTVVDKIKLLLIKRYRSTCDNKIEKTLDILMELLKYSYTTSQLIEFYLIKSTLQNKNDIKRQLREKRK